MFELSDKYKKFLFIFAAFILIFFIGIIIYALSNGGNEQSNKTTETASTIMDCGSITPTFTSEHMAEDNEHALDSKSKKAEECFSKNFSACKRAQVKINLYDNISYTYNILEEFENACKIDVKYLSYPKKEWVNKSMSCFFDNKKEFETASDDVMNDLENHFCEGNLVEILHKEYRN